MYVRSVAMVALCVGEMTPMARHRHLEMNDSHLSAAVGGIPAPFAAMAPPFAGVRTTGGKYRRPRMNGSHPSAAAKGIRVPSAIMMARLYAGARSDMARHHLRMNNSHPSAAVGFTPAPSAQTGPQGAGVQAPTIVFCHRHQENDSQPLAAARNMSAPSA